MQGEWNQITWQMQCIATLDSEKFAKNREKEGKKSGKSKKKRGGNGGGEMENLGRFCHFSPSDRQGWLCYLADDNFH